MRDTFQKLVEEELVRIIEELRSSTASMCNCSMCIAKRMAANEIEGEFFGVYPNGKRVHDR